MSRRACDNDIRLRIGSVGGWGRADAARLALALGNLLNNAIEYSPPGNAVRLSAWPTAGESRTGLGLWIVKQLFEAQEGQVRADFPASGGSRFCIGLPTAGDMAGLDAQR